MFLECSAKTRENVEKCFEELSLKVILSKQTLCMFNCVYRFICSKILTSMGFLKQIIEVPSLWEEGSNVNRNIIEYKKEHAPPPTRSNGGGGGFCDDVCCCM